MLRIYIVEKDSLMKNSCWVSNRRKKKEKHKKLKEKRRRMKIKKINLKE